MSKENKGEDAKVEVGENHVIVRRSGKSNPDVVGILGKIHSDAGAIERIVLDRKVHKTHDPRLGPWTSSGVIVTELVPYDDPSARYKYQRPDALEDE